MSKRYDAMVATGKYKAEDGTEKTSWTRVGAVFEKDGKFSLKIDSLPTSEIDLDGNVRAWTGWVKLFAPQSKGKGQSRRSAAPEPSQGGFEDDIPFN